MGLFDVTPGPDIKPRLFHLFRHEDESKISGVGIVADGVLFPCGYVVLCWRATAAGIPTVGWYPHLDAVKQIHGHNGKTEIRWDS